MNNSIPNCEEIQKGCEAYEEHEKRDSMYKVASFLLSHYWGNPIDMADSLGILLLTWNQAFYRYGSFSFNRLEKCIAENFEQLQNFRNKDIISLSLSDEHNIKHLFTEFLEALQIDAGTKQGAKSSVAVAKALHLLAPHFFPLWDYKIARAYGCSYDNPKTRAEKYISFCKITKTISDSLRQSLGTQNRTSIKLIDEYNYAKYTQGWL